MRSVRAAVYGPDRSTMVDRYLEMEKRRSISLDSLARLGVRCESQPSTFRKLAKAQNESVSEDAERRTPNSRSGALLRPRQTGCCSP